MKNTCEDVSLDPSAVTYVDRAMDVAAGRLLAVLKATQPDPEEEDSERWDGQS